KGYAGKMIELVPVEDVEYKAILTKLGAGQRPGEPAAVEVVPQAKRPGGGGGSVKIVPTTPIHGTSPGSAAPGGGTGTGAGRGGGAGPATGGATATGPGGAGGPAPKPIPETKPGPGTGTGTGSGTGTGEEELPGLKPFQPPEPGK